MQIQVHLLGGLGNQLFQYAAARYYQEKYNAESVIIETSNYKTFKLRELELGHYKLDGMCAFSDDTGFLQKLFFFVYRVYQKLYSMILGKFARPWNFKMMKKSYLCTSVYTPKTLRISNEVFLYGYFVSNEIAWSMRKKLMGEIVLKETGSSTYLDFLQIIETTNSIGISIRCDEDYVKNRWPIGTKKYYHEGIRLIKQKFHDINIFVFADRIDKVKNEQWFSEWNVYYIENTTVTESFELLRRCRHHIISNSTFSWWGAFLKYRNGGICVCMNRFFNERYKEDDKLTMIKDAIYLDYITGEIVKC